MLISSILILPIILLNPFSPFSNNLLRSIINLYSLRLLNIELEIIGDIKSIDSPAVIISNHQHLIDVFIATAIVPKNSMAVGKKEIMYIPIFGLFFWLSGNLLINRRSKIKAMKSLQKTGRIIKRRQQSIWIMPEGTRNKNKTLLPFKKGAFQVARLAEYKIVPVVFSQFANDFSYLNLVKRKIQIKILPTISHKIVTTSNLNDVIKQTHLSMEQTALKLQSESQCN